MLEYYQAQREIVVDKLLYSEGADHERGELQVWDDLINFIPGLHALKVEQEKYKSLVQPK